MRHKPWEVHSSKVEVLEPGKERYYADPWNAHKAAGDGGFEKSVQGCLLCEAEPRQAKGQEEKTW